MADEARDDHTIKDDDALWRRIPPWHFVFDENVQQRRISSAAFCDHPEGSPMSVDLGTESLAMNRKPADALSSHQGFGLAEFTAKLARSLAQGIARRPLITNPVHAEVFGNKSKGTRNKFARESRLLIAPPVNQTEAGDNPNDSP